MEYVVDSNIRVTDEILQKELSMNNTQKMRNIVATIQKEQNTIIRDISSPILVVQGVAGSGKTSIALHRVAYLLYQNRGKILSSDILIISPNRIFADYISNVLPELGEENISEVNFEEIASHEMEGICRFESKLSQMELLTRNEDEVVERINKIRVKGSLDFLRKMREYVETLERTLVHFSSYEIGDYVIKREVLKKWYNGIFAKEPLFVRLDKIGDRIADIYEEEKKTVFTLLDRNKIKESILKMASTTNVLSLYKDFIESIKHEYLELENDIVNETFLLYEDVFPVILLNLMLNGKKNKQFERIQHVIVDEMQDYTMIQYEILNILFNCKMTILGDINQMLDTEGGRKWQNDIRDIFKKNINYISMIKSYRSTYEISEFCKRIGKVNNVISYERKGTTPQIEKCADYLDMIKRIQEAIDKIKCSSVATLAIICKSTQNAERLYSSLAEEYKQKIYIMNKADMSFKPGIIVTNSFLAKGLEFDYVIVPEVTDEIFFSKRDRRILYIACTRALHNLDIFYYGRPSHFLDGVLF